MDNNTLNQNTNLADLFKKASEMRNILEKVKTGEGMGFTEEQKAEFKKQMENSKSLQDIDESIKSFDEREKQLQEMITNMNKPK